MRGFEHSQTAANLPLDPSNNGLAAVSIQDAVDKMAWLLAAQDMVDEEGNFLIKLGTPALDKIYVKNSSNIMYELAITNDGELTSQEAISNGLLYNSNLFRTPSNEACEINVTNDGEILVQTVENNNVYFLSRLFKKLILKSPNNTNWILGVTDNKELLVFSMVGQNGAFKIIDQDNNTVFGASAGSNGMNYLTVFNKGNLPQNPQFNSTSMPWVFLEENGNRMPIYFDGSKWRYFFNNSVVL